MIGTIAAPVLDGGSALLAPTPLKPADELGIDDSSRLKLAASVELGSPVNIELRLLILIEADKSEAVTMDAPELEELMAVDKVAELGAVPVAATVMLFNWRAYGPNAWEVEAVNRSGRMDFESIMIYMAHI